MAGTRESGDMFSKMRAVLNAYVLVSLKYQIPFFQEKIRHGFLHQNFLDMSLIKKRKSQANEA